MAALTYWDAGWRGVLPLPVMRKASPPIGWTGRAGGWPSIADVMAWAQDAPGCGNIGLRLPERVIGIDVDNYGSKLGAETLGLAEKRWGALPPTWRSTSRDDGISGIYLYRVPSELAWPGEIGPGVELIVWTHRYAVAWPSLHPEGRPYRWITPDGLIAATAVPTPDELPDLPASWVEGITQGRVDDPLIKADLSDHEIDAWLAAHGGGEPCSEMARCVDEYLPKLTGTTSRHDAARNATLRITTLAAEGHLGMTVALAQIERAFGAVVDADRVRRDDPDEWRRSLDGAVKIAAAMPVAKGDPCPPVTVLVAPVLDAADGFWSARPDLTLIHSAARAALCAPWTLFGSVIVRLLTAVPIHIVLPALVGTQASLNLFVALVGESGSGKGAPPSVATELLDVEAVEIATIGSGEGLAHLYARRTKTGVERTAEAVLLDVAEIDTLSALGTRQGSTLLPELRKAWMGEQLGFSYADPTKRLPIVRHSYRLCMIVGVQPRRAGSLLNDSDGGTPQRFLWFSTSDPGVPDIDTPKPTVGLKWRPSDLGVGWANMHGRREMSVPAAIAEHVRDAAKARLRGDGDALDGHALLARLKVAAALALLDKRMAISDEDWRLAGIVMAVSDATRASVVATLAAQNRETNRARGKAEADRAVLVADAVDKRRVARVAHRVSLVLAKQTDWMRHRDLHRAIAARDRDALPDAIEALFTAGQIEVDTSEPDRPSYRTIGAAK